MSDQSQGPGWWLASDGRWYPPDQAPAVPPAETWATPPPGPPPPSGLSGGAKGLIVGAAVLGLLLVVGLVALLVGSDGDDEPGPTTTTARAGDDPPVADVPEGFTVVEGDGVAIAAPDEWEEVAPEDFALTPDEMEEAFPDAPEGMVEQFSAFFEQGAVLVAFEPSFEFASNVNVVDAPGEAPLDIVEGQAEVQLESLGAEDVRTSRVELPVGDALRIQYSIDAPLPDGSSVPAEGEQYYIPVDGRTYIVTVSAAEDVGELAPTMLDTFTVG